MIEKGRHKRPIIPMVQRFNRTFPTLVQNEVFAVIEKEVINLLNLNAQAQYIFMMSRKQIIELQNYVYNTLLTDKDNAFI